MTNLASPPSTPKYGTLIAFVVICLGVVGYFTGLQSPMKTALQQIETLLATQDHAVALMHDATANVIPATRYADIGAAVRRLNARTISTAHTALIPPPGANRSWSDKRQTSSRSEHDFEAKSETVISPAEKAFALAYRERNRAFNGAPATIPHPIDQMSSQACMVCHAHGLRAQSLKVNGIPHERYSNCTQCHVEQNPQHMQAVTFRANSFAGLPAPSGGPRAFSGAPPQIPHSTWMRSECLSCHGFTSQRGLQTTHPWRQNCTQCHAPSAELDQLLLPTKPHFLPPLNVQQSAKTQL